MNEKMDPIPYIHHHKSSKGKTRKCIIRGMRCQMTREDIRWILDLGKEIRYFIYNCART
jgi:hypothetical protein